MYRGYIKNITNLNGACIGSSELRLKNFTINKDLLSSTTSEFELISVPSAVENGNIFGVYDDKGNIIYNGVITSVQDNVIRTNDIICIFDDLWLYRDPQLASIEADIVDIINNDFKDNNDSLVESIFSQFTVLASTTNAITMGLQEENYTVNFKDLLINLYSNYGLLVDITVPYSTGSSTIVVSIPTFASMSIADNTDVIRNFSHTSQVTETNKLVIYATNGAYRASYYATPSGITQNSAAVDRVVKMKSKIVFSDLEDLSSIVDENLDDLVYNHKITMELLLDNKLFDFYSFNLGQNFTIYWNGETFYTVLTAYKYSSDQYGHTDYVTLTFGKVRYSLSEKLQITNQLASNTVNIINSQKWLKQYYNEELGELSTTMGEITADLEDLQTDVSTVTQTANSLSGTVSSLQSTVNSSIATVTYTYGYGTSDTTHPADSAFTYSSMPARVDGQYIWRKMVTTTNAGATTTKYEMVQGADGASGTSVYIASQVVDYLESASGTTVPSGTWSTTIPDVADGNYLWTRTTVNYSDNTSTVSYSVARQGENGEEGSQIWTTTTAPTTPNYTFTISNLQGDSNVSPKIGDVIMYSYYRYTISSVSSSTVLCSTRQSLRGANGTSYYTYVRYSANSDGSSMTTAPNANTKYIGIYTGTSSTVPAYTEFTWSQYVGESVTVSEVMYASGTSGTTAPSSGWQASVPSVSQGDYLWTRTTYSDGQIVYTVARQGEDGANGTSVTVSGYTIQYAASSSGTTVPTSGWGNTPTATNGQYQWSRTTTSYSPSGTTITYSVAYIGTNGEDGDDGVGIEKIEEIRYLQLSEENTVSGRIATIDDAYEMDANSVVVDIDPIQDFNGYDHPWIGGAGKNLLPKSTWDHATSFTSNGITWTLNDDGTVTANGTATADSTASFIITGLFSGNYYYCANLEVESTLVHAYVWNRTTSTRGKKWDGTTDVDNSTSTANLQQVQLNDTDILAFNMRVISGGTVENAVFKPMIMLSTETDTSFAPYENICPISGRSTVGTNTTGVNVLPLYSRLAATTTVDGITYTANFEDGTITCNGTATANSYRAFTYRSGVGFDLTPFRGKTVTCAITPQGQGVKISSIGYLREDGTSVILSSYVPTYATVVIPNEAVYARFLLRVDNGVTVKNVKAKITMALGSTPTYEPYEGTTYTTALGQTVYGGTLDLVSGLLTVNKAYVQLSSTGSYYLSTTGSNNFAYSTSTKKYGYTNVISNRFKTTDAALANTVNGDIRGHTTNHNIYMCVTDCTTVAEFKTWLANNPTEIVYELDTPTTVQLTAQEVMLLRGINNIWADSGEVEVKYYTDPSVQLNAPALPSSVVTSLSTDEEQWTLAMPTYQARALYWLSLQTKFTDGTYSWGDAVPDSGVTDSFAMTQNLQTVLTKTRVELNASIQELSDRITSVVSEVDTIQDSYIDANGVEQILSTKEYATQSDVTQMSDSITVRFDEYVKYDDTEYQSLVTNILFNEEGINISASTIDTNLQLAADGVYIQDTGGDAIASMTATQFSTGDWVMQQSDYIFNIFKEHNS